MNRRQYTTRTLTLVAGLAVSAMPVLAGPESNARSSKGEPQRSYVERSLDQAAEHRRTLAFAEWSELVGTEVVNRNGTSLATVNDLIIDRGTGRIMSVVIRDGGLLGLGGKLVAVPYRAFEFNSTPAELVLDVTPEHLEQAPEFRAENWIELDSADWTDELRESYQETVRGIDADARDPFARGVKDADTAEFSGHITAVRRVQTMGGDENVEIDIRTEDDATRTVVLGPSWHVMSNPAAPMRTAKISVTAYELPRDAKGRLVAKSVEVNGAKLPLRDNKGNAMWYTGDHTSSAYGDDAMTPMLRITDLIGKDVNARGEDGGEIIGAILELSSGRVAMLELDPDENILGIADESKCLPWTIAAVGDESVGVDADRDMLLASRPMPEQTRMLSTPTELGSIYSAFRVDVAEFKPLDRSENTARKQVLNWSDRDEIVRAYQAGEKQTVTGKVRAVSSGPLGSTERDMRWVTLSTDRGEREIVLGPEWFVDQRGLDLGSGDEITVHAKRARVGDRFVLIASSVESADGTSCTLWSDERPAWKASMHKGG